MLFFCFNEHVSDLFVFLIGNTNIYIFCLSFVGDSVGDESYMLTEKIIINQTNDTLKTFCIFISVSLHSDHLFVCCALLRDHSQGLSATWDDDLPRKHVALISVLEMINIQMCVFPPPIEVINNCADVFPQVPGNGQEHLSLQRSSKSSSHHSSRRKNRERSRDRDREQSRDRDRDRERERDRGRERERVSDWPQDKPVDSHHQVLVTHSIVCQR